MTYHKTITIQRQGRDEPALDNALNFTNNNTTDLFKFIEKIISQTGNDDTKSVEIIVSLEYLSISWGTLKIVLFNCETNLIINWYKECLMLSNILTV